MSNQQDYAEEAPQGNSPYYMPTLMSSEKADLYDKIRPEDVVEALKNYLMGYEWDKQKQEWRLNKNFNTVALTELGAWQLSTLLLSISNKSTSISKLKDTDIRPRVTSVVRTAMKMCLRNWEEYGIRSPEQLLYIKEIVLSLSFIMLKQPENAGVRTFIQGVTQESRVIQEQPKKEGALGAIFRR